MATTSPDMTTIKANASTPTSGGGGLDDNTIIYICTTVVVGIGMIGIGCTVHYKILWYYLRRPKAYLLGVLLQLLLVPLVAWALAKMFQMPQEEALGVMIQGCCPGGTTSNIVVYWLDGVVDLSVAMTATSTLLAMGTLPLWLFIFQNAENITSFVIPFQELGITFACLVVPLLLGVLINAKFPKRAKIISKVLIILASLSVLIILIVTTVLRRQYFVLSWRQIVVAAIMPLLTYVIGYLATIVPRLRLPPKSRRTVALEVALQNVQVCAAVIQLTFAQAPRIQFQIILFPLIFYVFQASYAALMSLAYIFGKKYGWIKPDGDEVQLSQLEERVDEGQENPTFQGDQEKNKNGTI